MHAGNKAHTPCTDCFSPTHLLVDLHKRVGLEDALLQVDGQEVADVVALSRRGC